MKNAIDFTAGRAAVRARPQRQAAADLIAAQLFAAERAAETALHEGSKLLSLTIEQRRALNLSTIVGQAALSNIQASNARLIDAMTELGEAHGNFLGLLPQLGVSRLGIGDGDKPGEGHEEAAHRNTATAA